VLGATGAAGLAADAKSFRPYRESSYWHPTYSLVTVLTLQINWQDYEAVLNVFISGLCQPDDWSHLLYMKRKWIFLIL
jgi:hypothetical protein